jgi:hypothetical protein
MKVAQLFEEPLLPLPLKLKMLLKAGKTVRIDAHRAPITTGNDTVGWMRVRSPVKGSVYKLTDPWFDSLNYTRDEDFLYGQERSPRSMGYMSLMTPVDEHYTIRNLNGVWTIVDRGEVKKSEPYEPGSGKTPSART